MSEEDLDRINEDELNRSSQDSSPEIPEEQQDEELLSRDVSEDKLNLPKSKAPTRSTSRESPVRLTNPPGWACQHPLRHPHIFPEHKRPWDGYEGRDVEWFTSDPPDVLPAPPGWDGSPTRYYPGFGWVLPPIKPGYPYYIFPEDRGNPPGSINPPIPDWDGGYPYELPDPLDPLGDFDPGDLWGVDDQGNPYYNIPGFGQWGPYPNGLGGEFYGDDGRNWEWVPPRGHENDPSYLNDPCSWEWRQMPYQLDPDYEPTDPATIPRHRNSEVPREQRLNLEVLSRSMNNIRAWSSSLNEIRSWKRISGSDLLSFNESTRSIPHRTGSARFKKTGTIGKKETPSFDLKSFAVDIPKDYRPVRTQEDAEVPLRSGATGSRGPAGSQGPRGPQGRQGEIGPCCTGPTGNTGSPGFLYVDTGLTLNGDTLGIDPTSTITVSGISAAAITADIVHVKDQIKFANGMTAASIVTTVNGVSGDVTLTDLVGVATFNGAAGDVQGVSTVNGATGNVTLTDLVGVATFNGTTGGITTANLHLHVAGLSSDGGITVGSNVSMGASADIAGNLLVTGNLDVGTDSILRKNVTHLGSSMSVPTNFDIDNANGETVIAIDTRNVRIGDCDGAGNSNSILVRDSHDVITLTSTTISTNADTVSLNAATVKIPDNLEHLGDANTKLSFPSADNLVLMAGGVTFAHGTATGLYAPAGLSADGGVTFGSINSAGALQVDGNIHTDGGISADGGISGGHVHCATLTSDGAVNGTIFTASSYFSGTLIGNAQNALACSGVAASATTATGVAVTGVSDDVDYKVVITQHPGGGTSTLAAKTDSGSGADGLVYNPSADLLSLGGISAGSGVTLNAGLHVTGGSTFGSAINFQDNQLERPKFKDYAETVHAIGTITGNTAIDFSNGNVQTVTGNGNCEFSFTNPPATGNAGTLTLLITNGGANTTTWASAVKWPSNVAPSLTASGIDILSFVTIDGGSNIYGFVGGLNFS